MHDIKAIRDDPAAFDRGWESRGLAPQTAELLKLDEHLRAAQTSLQAEQSRRNEVAKLVGQAKAKKDDAAANALIEEAERLRYRISVLDRRRALPRRSSSCAWSPCRTCQPPMCQPARTSTATSRSG